MGKQDAMIISSDQVSTPQYDFSDELQNPPAFLRWLIARNKLVALLTITWACGIACIVGGGTYLDRTPSSSSGWFRIPSVESV